MVDVPADQVVAAERGVVVALRRPGDPALPIRVHEQRQHLLPVGDPVPADRAVRVGCDDQPRVRGDVDVPRRARHRPSRPRFAAVLIEQAQQEVCPENEMPGAGHEGQAYRPFIWS